MFVSLTEAPEFWLALSSLNVLDFLSFFTLVSVLVVTPHFSST